MNSYTLYPYQKEGIKWLVQTERGLLGDDVGLGKTVQLIMSCQILNLKHILVICPGSLTVNWEREFKKWCTEKYYKSIESLKIVTYTFFQKKENINYLKGKWDVVILDECQKVSNWTAKQTRNIAFGVAIKIKRLWMASATPAERYAGNWHSLLLMLEPGKWGVASDFYRIYCEEFYNVHKKKYDWRGFKNTAQLNKSISHLILRRKKSEVLPDLPERIYGNVFLPTDPIVVSKCAKIPEDVVVSAIENNTPIPAAISRLRMAIGLGKVDSFIEWCESFNKPLVIFVQHLEVAETVKNKLNAIGKHARCITGDINPVDRQGVVDSFQNGAFDFLVLTLDACREGLNIDRADSLCLLEFPWSYARLEQAIGRIDRLTTKHTSLMIYNFISVNTIDELVLRVLYSKKSGMENVIDG